MQITQLTIDNVTYQTKALFELSRSMVLNPDVPKWKRDVFSFLLDWMSQDKTITLSTSGTTGMAQSNVLLKSAMVTSAENTLQYFNLKKGDSVLLCLSTVYIAGMMMVVRAITGGLNLILMPPERNPWQYVEQQIDFAAVVPMQLQELLENKEYQKMVNKVLVGGVPLNQQLINMIGNANVDIYQSFGMTETLSHVAIRQLKHEIGKTPYTAMKGVNFSQDENGCLIIQADYLKEIIHTKDIVEMKDNHTFLWVGRADNIINSGGVKLYPEKIENKLSTLISEPFFIAGLPDKTLSQKVALFIETKNPDTINKDALKQQFVHQLHRYEIPKELIILPEFQRTKTGKVKRKKTIEDYLKNKRQETKVGVAKS